MTSKLLTLTSSLLEKSQDFRHFAFFLTFFLILDSYLIICIDTPLINFNFSFSAFSQKIELGIILLFFVFFLMFISFIVPAIRFFLFLLSDFLPSGLYVFFDNENERDWRDSIKNSIDLSTLKNIAVIENNNVAYQAYQNYINDVSREKALCHFCLSLFIALILNLCLSTSITSLIINMMDDKTLYSTVSLSLFIYIMIYCFFFGVLVNLGIAGGEKYSVYMNEETKNKLMKIEPVQEQPQTYTMRDSRDAIIPHHSKFSKKNMYK